MTSNNMPQQRGVLERVFHALGYERRSSLENPSTPLSYPAEWLLDIWNGGRTDSGIRVSEMTALQVSTVLACVNIISNGVASLPFYVYEKQIRDGRLAKRVAHAHPLFEILHTEPNDEMSSVTWRKTLQCHALLWGNGYCEVQRNEDNEIIALWPRNPSRTRPVRLLSAQKIEGTEYPAGTLVYEVHEPITGSPVSPDENSDAKVGDARIVLAEDMLHIPGLSLDGRLGQPTIQLARQVIGLALATEKYGAKFFGNNARPSGILEVPGVMTPKAIETLRRSWAEAHGGENAHKAAILEQGVKFTKVAATPEEGQYLETRSFQRNEIASIFGVPAHMVGDLEKSARSNVEQSSIEFVLYCLNPWLASWEAELKRKLFPRVGRASGKYFPKFDTRKLMYPDAESRSKFYTAGKQWGFLSTNDVRELEDMNPVENKSADIYWMPVNMQDAANPVTQPAPKQQTEEEPK
jgi:HK97 family phage portal protein